MRNRRSEPSSGGINAGSTSIIMIFAVLCLTVFSALALVTAVSEQSTAQKYADSVSAYYNAECNAEILRAELGAALAGSGGLDDILAKYADEYSITPEGDGYTCAAGIPVVPEVSQLSVVIHYSVTSQGVTSQVISEKLTNVGVWSPDESLELWDAETAMEDAGLVI